MKKVGDTIYLAEGERLPNQKKSKKRRAVEKDASQREKISKRNLQAMNQGRIREKDIEENRNNRYA